jgi:hypothetical protein
MLVWEGLTNREIAERIHTSEQVVKNHLRSAFDKLGVWSRLELALYVASHGGAQWEGSPLAAETPMPGPVHPGPANLVPGSPMLNGTLSGPGGNPRHGAISAADGAIKGDAKGLAHPIGGIPA